jgi:uncharacterized protein (DUF1015 family)
MALLRPIELLLPPPALAPAIASVPYDVVDTAEARALAAGKPWSFLHVIRPEIDLPEETDVHGDAVYAAGRSALDRFLAQAPFRSPGPSLLLYRLSMNGRSQVGVVGGCSLDEYDAGGIAIHERTRKDKEDDRARHVVTMRAQAEPIFLAYRRTEQLARLLDDAMAATPPLYDFVAEDGVGHSVFRVTDAAALAAAFASVPKLYVADGHHRAKSASRAREQLRAANPGHRGDEPYNSVLAVVFPHDHLQILPYNRVVTDMGGRSASDVLGEIGRRFPVRAAASPDPVRPHEFSVLADARWFSFSIPPQGDGLLENLDVSLLQEQVLAPVFGIADPRTDTRIDFVGGIRGTSELERRATAAGGVAFSLFPTTMDELFAVADAGLIMPPKSTWFEPKLRSGLFVHRI